MPLRMSQAALFSVILQFAVLAAPLLAQQEDPTTTSTLTVTTQIVAIDAVVHNPGGELAMALPRDAFTLKVDGKLTPIRYFNHDNDLPLTVGLLIDTSSSQRVYFDEEALSSENFLTNILTNPADRALVVRFDSSVVLLQAMTSQLKALHNALHQLDYVDPRAPARGSTLLYDAISVVGKAIRPQEAGRRAVIVLTDGEDHGSSASMTDAIHAAQRNGVAVYTVIYSNEMIGGTQYPHVPGMRASGMDVMRQVSKETGGREFVVGGGSSISTIYHDIEQDLRSQYRFGFTPPPSKPGKYHSLDLHTPDKHQAVQSRAGYFTPE